MQLVKYVDMARDISAADRTGGVTEHALESVFPWYTARSESMEQGACMVGQGRGLISETQAFIKGVF